MGLIKAAMGAVDGVMADQWKEFFYCDSLDKDTLAARGQKRTSSGQELQHLGRGQYHHEGVGHRRQ